ncbi:MAG TPA: phosphomethylpyrimidine synthase, partial [Verrucomicrobiales bacterium]|nr:phosphomethylpyrimidine synthase [Verrucomicrobiales bacterium]
MIADPKSSFEPHSSHPLPNNTRVYVSGAMNPNLRVPMREIELSPTKAFNGRIEINEPVRVYDCSGPWGDPEFRGTVEEGLPPHRRDWILRRGDVAEYDGREVKPQDNGYLSRQHAEYASQAERNRLVEFPGLQGQRRRPLKASTGHPVTQLWYARQGIITPEMEFIAIRENLGTSNRKSQISDARSLTHQHPGASQISNLKSQIPDYTPSVFRRFP